MWGLGEFQIIFFNEEILRTKKQSIKSKQATPTQIFLYA